MADQGSGRSSPTSVRQKAEQDLASIRSRLADTERQLLQLKIEERELNNFLKRLSRYEPEEDKAIAVGRPDDRRSPSLRLATPRLGDAPSTSSLAIPSIPRPNSRRGLVNKEAHEYLNLIQSPATTSEIVEYIRNEKRVFSYLGMNPVGTLSSYLSRDPRFSFDKSEGGWVTVAFDEDKADQGA